MRKILAALFLVLILLVKAFLPVYATVPYQTFTRSGDQYVLTQTAYEPYITISRIGPYTMSHPQDIRLGSDGLLYIADTGNSRILVATQMGEWVKTIGYGYLQSPQGVFRTDEGLIYVADTTAQTVFVFDETGELIDTYTRPHHPLFGRYAPFMPQKVVVDRRGNLYIASQGNTNGVIQLATGTGEFLGYFGANITNVNWWTAFRQFIDRQNQILVAPITVTNVAICSRGLIYTVSRGDNISLKRLNVAGRDILNLEPMWNFPDFIAVTVTEGGNIFAATHNWIVEYTAEGDLLFLMASNDDGRQRAGLFSSISGLAVHDGTIFVLDELMAVIQVLVPTEFVNEVHTAFTLFNEGRYSESMVPWQNVMRMNSMFAYAGVGLGEAHFRNREHHQARDAFRRGFSREGYSDAFWEIRSDWMRDNTATIMVWGFALIVAWGLIKFVDRRVGVLKPVRAVTTKIRGVTLFSQCTFALRNITNPYDAAYGIKHENKGSYKSAFILLFLFYVLYVLDRYFSGFLFRSVPDGQYDLVWDALFIIVVVGLPIICCYLVSAISDGEASFKNLFVGVIYAFAPLFIIMPLVIALGNVLTLNEAFFITFFNFIAYTWTAVLIFLAIKNLNDYTFGKTFSIVFITVFVTLILALLVFIMYVLVMQVADFVVSVVREVVFRIAE
ncbi:MAG: YIP1 family protein [Defluviitaleaceae bacterium]|nr:YIP1 family protein [Defluviitaleaceae bacterium]